MNELAENNQAPPGATICRTRTPLLHLVENPGCVHSSIGELRDTFISGHYIANVTVPIFLIFFPPFLLAGGGGLIVIVMHPEDCIHRYFISGSTIVALFLTG